MPAIQRIYNCERYGTKYLLEKPAKNRLILYKVGPNGELTEVQKKTYTEYFIYRKASFRRNSEINRPTVWESKVYRRNKIESWVHGDTYFSIKNKGDIEDIDFKISGYTDRFGNLTQLDKLNLKDISMPGDSTGKYWASYSPLSNLARVYLRKLGILSNIPPNGCTHYISPDLRKILDMSAN